MKDYEIIDYCLLCGSNIKQILSLGSTPLANEFIKPEDDKKQQDVFPLNLVQCQSCDHVQIDCIVNEERLYRNYNYVSGTSEKNIEHFDDYARQIMAAYYNKITFDDGDYIKINEQNDDNKMVLDIGSNDGTFLKAFKKYGLDVLGIDPAVNLKHIALQNGINTITEFFNKKTAVNIIKQHCIGKKIKVITCNNVFAHNKNLNTIIEGVLELLDDDGIFILENSYLLDILDKTLIDLIYHEHMHHHHLRSLKILFEKHNMEIFRVQRIPNHGGSIRVFVCRKYTRNIDQSVKKLEVLENDINEKLINFKPKAEALKEKVKNRLLELNGQIIIYGFAAKSTTLLYYFDIDPKIIKFGVDDAFLKQNKLSPGKHIYIFDPGSIGPYENIILLLAWNFADSIIENNKNFKGKWIIPLPEYREIN